MSASITERIESVLALEPVLTRAVNTNVAFHISPRNKVNYMPREIGGGNNQENGYNLQPLLLSSRLTRKVRLEVKW